ncbi:MAG: phosphoribosyltransferase family protein [Planctomycetota bacterium]|jgi:hypoxanthine phosphoribosyltransferase
MEIWLVLLIAAVSIVIGGLLTWIIGKKLGEIQQTELLNKLKDAVLDREFVSVNEEFLMTQLLAEKIQDAKFKPDVIIAVCPGGAMIAEWLSRRFLGNRLAPIPVQLLNMVPQQKKENTISTTHIELDENWAAIPPGLSKDSKVLVVNDISRTSHTIDKALNYLTNSLQVPIQNIQTAILIYSQQLPGDAKPTYYVAKTTKTIHFDWKTYD